MNRPSVLLFLLFTTTGCASRQHLYSTVGAAKNDAFRVQASPRRQAKPPRALSSFDAEIELENYQAAFTKRTSLSAASPSGLSPIGRAVTGADLSGSIIQGGSIQLQAR